MKLKKILAVLLAAMMLTCCMTGCGSAASDGGKMLDEILSSGEMKVALSPDFAPMEFCDPNKTGQDQYVGFDITLAQYIADELGVKLVIEAMDFDSCQAAVGLKSVNMSISGFSKTADREENYNLSDYYYAGDNESDQCILILKDRAAELNTADAFTGKQVAAQNASLQMDLLTAQLPDATAVPVINLNTAVMELLDGKVDALCVAKGNGEAFIQNYPELVLSDYQFTVEETANVILLPKGEDKLTERVNEILAKAYDAGVYGGWYEDAKTLADKLGVN